MARRIILASLAFFFIFLLPVISVYAASIPPEDKPLWRNFYYGTLGKNTGIAMILTNFPDGRLIGTYRYVKNGIPIRLSGKLENGDNLELVEKAPNRNGNATSEKVSGKFTGYFGDSFKNINGTWTSPNGTKSFSFALKQGVLIDSKTIEDQPDNKGFIVHTDDIPFTQAKSFCVAIGITSDESNTRPPCKNVKFTQIAATEDKKYFEARYEEKGPDSLEKFVVLFEVADNKAKPFWIYKDRDDGSSLGQVKPINMKAHVLEITYNSGGTRPSWNDFIIRNNFGFSLVNTEDMEHEVEKVVQGMGYETRNTLSYDFTNLQASNILYKSTDPNCCGSAEIKLSFEIKENRMVLKKHEIEKLQ